MLGALTLVSTVGTSLLDSNLSRLPTSPAFRAWLSTQPEADRTALTEDFVGALQAKLAAADDRSVARLLRQLPASTRLLGAEITCIHELRESGLVELDAHLIFAHSATESGRRVGRILAAYYADESSVVVEEVPDLQDEDARRFKTHGLRNLGMLLGRVARERSNARLAFNATGGYKAQIALAVAVGQALGVPVYYKHERFSEVIAFPPLPIAFDERLWARNVSVLDRLAQDEPVAESAISGELEPPLRTLLEHESIDGTGYLSLGPLGHVFHDTMHARFAQQKRLGADLALTSAPDVFSRWRDFVTPPVS